MPIDPSRKPDVLLFAAAVAARSARRVVGPRVLPPCQPLVAWTRFVA